VWVAYPDSKTGSVVLTATANCRVRLICLCVLVDTEGGRAASSAWGALSGACHQHAYELSPSVTEIANLVHVVRALGQIAPTPPQ
jgi:hypothetical protein